MINYENGGTVFHAPNGWENNTLFDALPTDVVVCPVCGETVHEDDAGRVCPANNCYPFEAGGWI